MFKRFAVGFAAGYVFGARAGEKRYEQMTELAQRALDVPWVQRLAEGGQTMAMDQGRRVLSNIRERARWTDERGADEDEDQDAYDEDEEGAYDEDEDGAYDEDEDEEGAYDEEEERVYGH